MLAVRDALSRGGSETVPLPHRWFCTASADAVETNPGER